MSRAEHRTAQKWNRVVGTICSEIEAVADDPLCPEEKRRQLRGLSRDIRAVFRGRRLFRRPVTLAQLAGKYAACRRTISYWKRAGCPFAAGQWKVLDWVSERRVIPRGTRARFARQLERRWRTAKNREFLDLIDQAKALSSYLSRGDFDG
jgi:hypothetical protein